MHNPSFLNKHNLLARFDIYQYPVTCQPCVSHKAEKRNYRLDQRLIQQNY